MSRLIDADALLDDAFERYCKDCGKRKGIKNGKYRIIYDVGEAPCRACDIDDMNDELENAPTVDAVPVVHGHWIVIENDQNTDDRYKMQCSVCGETLWSIEPEELYCCKCGAKMDEVSE